MSGQAKKADSKKGQKQAQGGAMKAEDAKVAVPQVKQDGKDDAKDTTLLRTSVELLGKQEAVSLSEPSPMDMGSAPSKTHRG
jgi:predicted Zn-dependent protease with MMP-like domain